MSGPPDHGGLSASATHACIHCGMCLQACPTYRVLGEEMDSPRGRIYLMRAVAEGRTELSQVARHFELCLGCGACETACPSGVPYGELLESTRHEMERTDAHSAESDRDTLELLLKYAPYPERVSRFIPLLRFYQASGLQHIVRKLRLLAPFEKLQAMEATLPELPDGAPLPEMIPAVVPRRGVAGLHIGCVQRHLFPDVNADTAFLLSAAGYDVVVPKEQGCCGALHLHAGRIDEFRGMATKLAASFDKDVDIIVSNAAGCGSTLKASGRWTDDGAFASKVRDVSEVLVACDLPFKELRETVAYHDACHLAHAQRIRTQPRALLAKIPGLTLVELEDSDQCCGSAGIYNMLEPAIADELASRKVACIRESGARVVATGNPGCLVQIARRCAADGLEIAVVHPVSLLARALR